MGRVHLDTSVLLEAEAFNSLVTNNNVKSGRFELVVSPFALEEFMQKISERGECQVAEGLCVEVGRSSVKLYHLTPKSWSVIHTVVDRLSGEIERVGLYDVLILAVAVSDSEAEYLITLDESLSESRAVREVVKRYNSRLKIRDSLR